MKFLNEVIENPFDPDRFIEFAGLVFDGLRQSDAGQTDRVRSGVVQTDLMQPGADQRDTVQPGTNQVNQIQPDAGLPCQKCPGTGSIMPSGDISVIKIYNCGGDAKVAVLAVRAIVPVKTVSEVLASIQCEAAFTAFYEDNVHIWKLSYVKLLHNNQMSGASQPGNCGVKRTSFIMGVDGTRGTDDLTAIVNAAAQRQLLNLLRRKGRISLTDIEKAFSSHVFTRNVIKAFNQRYPDASDLSGIVWLPGFKPDESEPFDRVLAIDPEMLGNIFVSRLKKGDRKNSGAFYTPLETVSFMCRESLAQYVSNVTELPYEDCWELLGVEGPTQSQALTLVQGKACTTEGPTQSQALTPVQGTACTAEGPTQSQALTPVQGTACTTGGLTQSQGLMPDEHVRSLPGMAAVSLIKIDRALQQVRVFDPAAGSGAFVLGMLKEITRVRYIISAGLCQGAGKSRYELMLHTVANCIFAADTDEEAVRLTKLRLRCALASANGGGPPEPERFCHVACCDSLDDSADMFKNDPSFAGVISEKGGFDIVIGNPPYISAVEDARYGNPLRDSLKAKYPILKGSFDIYTAFLLEGVRQTNKEGVYCWIVPNSLLSSRYALPVLDYLKQNGLRRSISVSDIDIFHNVGVYPVIAIGNKKANSTAYGEYIAVSADNPGCAEVRNSACYTGYGSFKDYGVRIASGAAGFQAKALAGCISEDAKDHAIPFVVSGSIDKYSTGFKNVRYMGKTWPKAFITKSGDIAQSKWRLWCGEKIIIAGLAKEIEADYSREPLALGVGTYAIYDFGGFDPLYLLGLLNSRFMSEYLREQFYEKHLAGGYLAINKAMLEQLPLVPADPAIQEAIAEKAGAVKAMLHKQHGQNEEDGELWRAGAKAGEVHSAGAKTGEVHSVGKEAAEAHREKRLRVELQCKDLLDDIDRLVDQLFAYHHFR